MPVFSFLGDGLGCSGFRFGWVGFGLVLAWFELVRVVLDSFFVPVSYTHLTLPTNREV